MRALMLTAGSILLTTLVVTNAYYTKKQFYPSVIYLTKSSPSMAVLYLQALVMVYLIGQVMKKVFFGQLRAAEVEHLIERSWYAVTETCLAFTVFRDDFNTKFVAMFVLLLFFKCFHWLAEDRIDFMERSPVISWLFHLRAVALLALLSSADLILMRHAYQATLMRGASVQLVFGFEYTVLFLSVLSTLTKYVLHTIDSRDENPWEAKAVYLLYSEFILSGLRLTLYALFLFVMVRVHTFPLFAIRPMYVTFRAFRKAFSDMVLSRRAIREMNVNFRDATEADLAADNTCIICREDMTPGAQGGTKVLPCDHIFHAACLRSWFQRQQTCPTCRRDILTAPRPATTTPAAGAAQPAAAANGQPGAAAAPAGGIPPPPITLPPHLAALFAAGAPPPPPPTASAADAPPQPPPWMFFGGGTAAPTFPGMPPPPPDLGKLSEAELAAMEGAGRDALQARVEHLQRISTLLDAAVLQMQQYMQVINRTPIIPPTPPKATTSPAPAAASTSAPPAVASAAAASASLPTEEVKVEPSEEAVTSDTTEDSEAAGSDEADEVRKRREGLLRRIESQTDI